MKTVLITGANRGIGKALADIFLVKGYFVIGTSTKGKTDSFNPNFKMLKLDLANQRSIQGCIKKIFQLKKRIDILVNNAAVILEKPNDPKINIKALRKTLEVNLLGTIHFTELLTQVLNFKAHILNISSRQGSFSYPLGTSTPSYKISKAAINMFTRVLSYQLKKKATVSSVHPGAVKSGLAGPDANLLPDEAAKYIYNLAISKPKTGQFWYKGKKFPW